MTACALGKILWTVSWRGNAQLRGRIGDELRSPEQVTTFVKLAKDGACMARPTTFPFTSRSRRVAYWA